MNGSNEESSTPPADTVVDAVNTSEADKAVAGTTSPTTATPSTTATNTLIGHIEAAGKAELEALKPLIASIIRKFVRQYEDQHMTGLVGKIERHVLNAVVDSAFGPAPDA